MYMCVCVCTRPLLLTKRLAPPLPTKPLRLGFATSLRFVRYRKCVRVRPVCVCPYLRVCKFAIYNAHHVFGLSR